MQMFRNFGVIHFAFFALLMLAKPLVLASSGDALTKVSGPAFTQKYSELFIARFYKWSAATFKLESNLNQKQQQTLKALVGSQNDFLVKYDGTYINTFALGYVSSQAYTGISLRLLRTEAAIDKSIESLTGHKAPEFSKALIPLYRGFELQTGVPAKVNYLAVVKNQVGLELQTFEYQNSWVLVGSVMLNRPPASLERTLIKNYYQTDGWWFHTTGFVNENYLSLPAQKTVTLVRGQFNLDPGLVQFTDNKNFSIYYP